VTEPVFWIADYAARAGHRYTPDADERWLRVWEPYATLKTPLRYEHTLDLAVPSGSMSIARYELPSNVPEMPKNMPQPKGPEAWIVIAQDERLMTGRIAATSDAGNVFGEPLDLVPLARRKTGDAAFDHVFASFSETPDDIQNITPSLRKLLLSWRAPLHFELRRGGFIFAPIAVRADVAGLSWIVSAAQVFAEKAAKSS